MFDLFDVCYVALKELSFPEFIAVLCVMLESKCKEEGVDIKEAAKKVHDTIIMINNELGEI